MLANYPAYGNRYTLFRRGIQPIPVLTGRAHACGFGVQPTWLCLSENQTYVIRVRGNTRSHSISAA